MTPKKGEPTKHDPQDTDPASAADTAPVDHDSHGNELKRVPGPGPKDAGKGAAGDDAVEQLKRR
jgi:hypothetical protein